MSFIDDLVLGSSGATTPDDDEERKKRGAGGNLIDDIVLGVDAPVAPSIAEPDYAPDSVIARTNRQRAAMDAAAAQGLGVQGIRAAAARVLRETDDTWSGRRLAQRNLEPQAAGHNTEVGGVGGAAIGMMRALPFANTVAPPTPLETSPAPTYGLGGLKSDWAKAGVPLASTLSAEAGEMIPAMKALGLAAKGVKGLAVGIGALNAGQSLRQSARDKRIMELQQTGQDPGLVGGVKQIDLPAVGAATVAGATGGLAAGYGLKMLGRLPGEASSRILGSKAAKEAVGAVTKDGISRAARNKAMEAINTPLAGVVGSSVGKVVAADVAGGLATQSAEMAARGMNPLEHPGQLIAGGLVQGAVSGAGQIVPAMRGVGGARQGAADQIGADMTGRFMDLSDPLGRARAMADEQLRSQMSARQADLAGAEARPVAPDAPPEAPPMPPPRPRQPSAVPDLDAGLPPVRPVPSYRAGMDIDAPPPRQSLADAPIPQREEFAPPPKAQSPERQVIQSTEVAGGVEPVRTAPPASDPKVQAAQAELDALLKRPRLTVREQRRADVLRQIAKGGNPEVVAARQAAAQQEIRAFAAQRAALEEGIDPEIAAKITGVDDSLTARPLAMESSPARVADDEAVVPRGFQPERLEADEIAARPPTAPEALTADAPPQRTKAEKIAGIRASRPPAPKQNIPMRPKVDVEATKPSQHGTTPPRGGRPARMVLGGEGKYVHPGDSPTQSQPVKYAVVEADDMVPSNDPLANFSRRKDYPDIIQDRDYLNDPAAQDKVRKGAAELNAEWLVNKATSSDHAPPIITPDGVVLSGNSRTQMLMFAGKHNPDSVTAYRAYLREHAAEYGLSPAQIDQMKNPVLARVIEPSEGRAVFATKANGSPNKAMSPAEIAAMLDKKMTPDMAKALAPRGDNQTLADILNEPRSQRALIEELDRLLGQNNSRQFVDGDTLNVAGKDLLKQTMYYRAVGDRDLATFIVREEAGLRQKVDLALSQLMAVKRLPKEFRIDKGLHDTLRRMANNPNASDPTSLLRQQDFTSTSEPHEMSEALATLLYGKPSSLREGLKEYIARVDGGQEDMWSVAKTPTEILNEIALGRTQGAAPKPKPAVAARMGKGIPMRKDRGFALNPFARKPKPPMTDAELDAEFARLLPRTAEAMGVGRTAPATEAGAPPSAPAATAKATRGLGAGNVPRRKGEATTPKEAMAKAEAGITYDKNTATTKYGAFDRFKANMFDDLRPLEVAQNKAVQKGMLDFRDDPESAPYQTWRKLAGGLGRATDTYNTGVRDWNTGKVIAPPLREIEAMIEPELWPKFDGYMMAKRNFEDALEMRGIEQGMTMNEARLAVEGYEADYPQFKKASERFQQTNRAVLKVVKDSGLHDEAMVEALDEAGKAYVSLKKLLEGDEVEMSSHPSEGLTAAGIRHKLKGSKRKVQAPTANTLENWMGLLAAADHNNAKRLLADLADYDDTFVTKFGTERPKTGGNIMSYNVDGKTHYARLDPFLYEAMNSRNTAQRGMISSILGGMAQVYRTGVIFNPEYVVRNAMRDSVTASIIAAKNSIPGLYYAKGIVPSMKAMVAELRGKPMPKVVSDWMFHGGDQGMEMGFYADKSAQNKAIQRDGKLSPLQKGMMSAKSAGDAIQLFVQHVSERPTRIGYFKSIYDDAIKRGLSEKQAGMVAAYEARNLMDFALGGMKTKKFKRSAAFFGSQLAGMYREAEALKDPRAWARAAVYVTAPTLLLEYALRDNKQYQDMKDWKKDVAWWIPIPGSDGAMVPIPRPPGPIGLMFGTIPSRIARALKGDDKAWDGMLDIVARESIPNPIPTGVRPPMEQFFNRKLFPGGPVVGRQYEDLPPDLQFNSKTSLVGRRLGEATGVISPMRFDQVVRSSLGPLGTMGVAQIGDRLVRREGEALPNPDAWPMRKFYYGEDERESEALDRFYDRRTAARKGEARYRANGDKSERDRDYKWLEQDADYIADLRKRMDKATSPEEKTRLFEKIRAVALKWEDKRRRKGIPMRKDK